MCLSAALARPFAHAPGHTRWGHVVLSGLAIAVVGVAGFGLAHAILIVPIWTRLPGGVPFAVGAGLALAWAFGVLCDARGSQSIASGVQFGAVMFLTLLPATALEAAMRWLGLRTLDWWEVIPAITLAILSGASAGWFMTRQGVRDEQRRGVVVAFAVATLALMFVSAGPLPVAQSARGAWLSLAIAPICLVCGAALSVLRGVLVPRSDSGEQGPPE